MSQRANEAQGEFATEAVADRYGLVVENGLVDWYDAVNDGTGTKYEVKSTSKRIGDDYPAAGRFRLWRDQHRSLQASDASGVAWYAFVLLDDDGNVVEIQRRKPATVGAIVRERGGWNLAGHTERDGPQHKLPWTEVVDA
ncbi:hypothetical protein [Halostella salina]|uniref:hypothetical protein n=1 Tax=Halostella salina TaxID=1547897 RepID=UPI000EF7C3C8|nr:hypothetical protein [Halostella salina]